MIQNNNFSPLPFYELLEYQNHRKWYVEKPYPLITPKFSILPFQIVLGVTPYSYYKVFLVDLNNESIKTDITNNIEINNYSYDTFVVAYYLGSSVQQISNIGNFYLIIEFYNTNDNIVFRRFSEVFNVVNNARPNLLIEWWDSDNILFTNNDGAIIYEDNNYQNRIYVCSSLGKPSYIFEESGDNRDGYFFPDTQISYKVYRFNFLAPEYLTDVMRLIRLHDYIYVTYQNIRYKCNDFLINVQWQGDGNVASVDVEFKAYTVVKKIGSIIQNINEGDFNNDFNNDFNK